MESLQEPINIFSMDEHTLTLFVAGSLILGDFRDCYKWLTFTIDVSVDIIDTCLCADAP